MFLLKKRLGMPKTELQIYETFFVILSTEIIVAKNVYISISVSAKRNAETNKASLHLFI